MAADPLTPLLWSVGLRNPVERARAFPLLWMDLASNHAYSPANHLWLLQDYALALAGRRLRRLIVQMPPRHGKSTFLSHYFPAWWLGRFPDQRIILTSAVAERAADWGGKARDVLTQWGEQVFGVRVSRDWRAAARGWDVEAHLGGMLTAGIGGPITGRGADLLIIDDPLKNAEEADSTLQRDRQWDWLLSTALPRLEPQGVVVLIMARWHEDDLAGRALREQPHEWTLLNLPALAEPHDPLGRPEGAPLWPERFDLAALEQMRVESGRWWDALYQGHPSPPGGAVFKLAWWDAPERRYDAETMYLPTSPRVQGRWLFLDTAFKRGEEHDWTACATIELLADYRLRLTHLWKRKIEFPDLLDAIIQASLDANADGKLAEVVIEDKGAGTSALQSLKAATGRHAWLKDKLVPFAPQGSKDFRARQAAQWCSMGAVLLPLPSLVVPWLYDFEVSLRDFPRAAHDDDVDTLSMGALYLEHYLALWAQGLSRVGAVV